MVKCSDMSHDEMVRELWVQILLVQIFSVQQISVLSPSQRVSTQTLNIPIGILPSDIPRKFRQSYEILIGLSQTGLGQKWLGLCHFMSIWLTNLSIGICSDSDRNRWGNVKPSNISGWAQSPVTPSPGPGLVWPNRVEGHIGIQH